MSEDNYKLEHPNEIKSGVVPSEYFTPRSNKVMKLKNMINVFHTNDKKKGTFGDKRGDEVYLFVYSDVVKGMF